MTFIHLIRKTLGKRPRSLPWLHRLGYLKVPQPSWAGTDPLGRVFADVPHILKTGQVVWGHLIQANRLLFEAGPYDCPGEVLYGADPSGEVTPEMLSGIANDLYTQKNSDSVRPGLEEIAEYLTDERIRVFGLNVPAVVSRSLPCQISTVFFFRKHLPNGILSMRYFPILVSDRGTAMVVPSRYWPAEFVKMWEAAERAKHS